MIVLPMNTREHTAFEYVVCIRRYCYYYTNLIIGHCANVQAAIVRSRQKKKYRKLVRPFPGVFLCFYRCRRHRPPQTYIHRCSKSMLGILSTNKIKIYITVIYRCLEPNEKKTIGITLAHAHAHLFNRIWIDEYTSYSRITTSKNVVP